MLYKYLHADFAMQAIEHKRLKVSRLKNLNDIYDARPRIIYETGSPLGKNDEFEKHFNKQVIQNLGINCYCGESENLLLWSHYGDSHRGVALGFDIDEGWFQPDNDNAREAARLTMKVDYPRGNRRAVLHWKSDIEPLPVEHQMVGVLKRGYTVKGWDWKYENEYREFVFLSKCVPSGTLYFSNFRPGSLRQVILGERCPLEPKFVADLAYHARDLAAPTPTILRARSDENSFRVNIEDALA
jgi:hypothetical protein